MVLRRSVRRGWCFFAFFWPIIIAVIVTIVLINAFRPRYDPSQSSDPTVLSIAPRQGPEVGGTIVTINGSGFTRESTVMFGNPPATGFTFINSNKLTAISPPGTGTVDVQVTTDGRTSPISSADKFTYIPTGTTLTVTSIAPATGPTAGGTPVTINGTNFAPGSTVSFGGVPATAVTFVSSTQLLATSPPGTNTVNVQVTTAAQISPITPADQFTYIPTGTTLTVTSIAPAIGLTTGGTPVTINGSGFTPASTVSFGGVPATGVKFISSNQLTATSPASTSVPFTGNSTVLATDSVYNNNGFVAGGSTTPTPISLPAGTGRVLTFNSVTGQVNGDGSSPTNGTNGPDGVFVPLTIPTVNGISGIVGPGRWFLEGVFLNGLETGTQSAPPSLDFTTGLGASFASLSPQIDQTFFIGDGLTGTGTGSTQQFNVPDSATSLVLGVFDMNGAYGDNSGSFAATYSIGRSTVVDVQVTANGQTSAITPADKFTYSADPPLAGAARVLVQPAEVTLPSDPLSTPLLALINSYRTQKGMQRLVSSTSLAGVAQQYTEDILANPNTTTDVTLIAANSKPPITFTDEVDAVFQTTSDAQQLFNAVQSNAITMAAMNNPNMTSFGSYFTNDPTTPGGFKGTVIFGQGVSP